MKMEMIEKPTRKAMEDEEANPATTRAYHESPTNGYTQKSGNNRHRKRRQLVAELLSELEEDEEEEEEEEEELKQERKMEKPSSSSGRDEEIIQELQIIKRQNTITHYLLTASILVTLAWQLSEISLIFKIRQGLSNPLKSIGGLIKALFTSSSSSSSRRQENGDHDNNQDALSQIIPQTYLPGIKIPDLSHLELPGFDTSNGDDD